MAVPKIGRKEDPEVKPTNPEVEAGSWDGDDTPTLDEAAEVLAKMLPPDTLLFIREASESLHAPLWQMLCGYAMNCADRMQLYTPHLMAAWAFGGGATRERSCDKCGSQFDSVFPEAMYCCSNCYFDKISTMGHTTDCPAKTVKA